ncbi:hypothetical protein LTR56_018347 [Elasticomyces elasticus]|nr:hypothetical protein LTR56_018347 [Elasticomyces elasticus]
MANRITISSLLNPIPASEQTPSSAQPQTPANATPTQTSTALDYFAKGSVIYDGNEFTASDFNPAKTYAIPSGSKKNALLRLAMHYSDEEILEKTNAGRPIPAFRGLRHVQNRIRQARTWLEKEVEPLLPKSDSEAPRDSRLQGMVDAMGPVKSERYKIRNWIREERLKNGAGLKRTAADAEEVSKRVKN